MNKRKLAFPKIEEEILKFWQDNKIFEKSVDKDSPQGDYIFYDGPPFATGLPHYGHILSSVTKDLVARYWTMKGYRVPRHWGWDCHGLPIENIIEKNLKTSGKKEIENKIGVDKFNQACCSKVLRYVEDWKKMVHRIGRWVDFDGGWKTMDPTYMESVWWAVKTIWDKGLIYEGRKVLMYCPRCESPISKAEVAMDNSYKDITEESITVKFKVKNPEKHGLPENTYILSWTTTPWTLPANVALAVGKDINYVIIKILESKDNKLKDGESYILSENTFQQKLIVPVGEEEGGSKPNREYYLQNFNRTKIKVTSNIKGKNLIGIEYEPLVDIPVLAETGKKAWYVTDADFVNTEEGTGVVHTAVVYGEEDYELGLKKDLPVVPLLDDKGVFNDKSPEFIRGKYFKNSEKIIVKYLEDNNLLFSRKKYTHSYPHCWRCDTQLFYNAVSAWFINVQKIKSRLIELNEKINWYPEHLKHGRFLNILETAPDWNISRNRFFASPLPIWKCDNPDCQKTTCIGGVAELKAKAINFDTVYKTDQVEEMDLHKHLVDKVKLKCDKCQSEMTRIPEVIDCWVESSSMPFAEMHYPFENEKEFKERYPGQYISEYIGQTRAWFYYMHVMATLLFDEISFENCLTNGNILNDKGEKLSKSKQNYTDPWEIIDRYGVDSLRYYLMTSVVMNAENMFFKDAEVDEIYKKVINILSNVLTFYQTFSQDIEVTNLEPDDLTNVLDIWITSKLENLKAEVTEHLDNYNTVKAGRPIKDFIDELSTWYVRRSRNRFKSSDPAEKLKALKTLRRTLFHLARIIAPFMPYMAEHIYKELNGNLESVHLESWPKVKKELIDEKALIGMELVRKIVEAGLAARAEARVKVRQPLTSYSTTLAKKLPEKYVNIIKDELNISELKFGKDKLDTELTPELKEQGLYRELVRFINALRKNAGLTIQDQITIYYQTDSDEIKTVFDKFANDFKKDTISTEIKAEKPDLDESWQKEVKINDATVWLGLKK